MQKRRSHSYLSVKAAICARSSFFIFHNSPIFSPPHTGGKGSRSTRPISKGKRQAQYPFLPVPDACQSLLQIRTAPMYFPHRIPVANRVSFRRQENPLFFRAASAIDYKGNRSGSIRPLSRPRKIRKRLSILQRSTGRLFGFPGRKRQRNLNLI